MKSATGRRALPFKISAGGNGMAFYNDDDDELPGDHGPIVVKRKVYDAGEELEAEVKAGKSGPACENAREKAAACRAAGDREGGLFWGEVFDYLMSITCLAADAETIILEEGQTYNPPEDEEIE
jgi:hypothetical protein